MKMAYGVIVSLLLMNAYLLGSIRLRLGSHRILSRWILLFFILFTTLQLVVPLFDWSRALINHNFNGPSYELLVQASYLSLGVMSCLFIFMFIGDLITLVAWFVLPLSWVKAFGYSLLLTVLLLTSGSVAWGIHYAGRVEVSHIEMPIRNLPPSFNGFTIAQISDVHIGRFLKRDFAERIAALVKELKPDAIALTGDLVDGVPSELVNDIAPFGWITAPYGKYYVTGNHEYYWGFEPWVAEVKNMGFHVFENSHFVIEKDSQKLVLAGVNDPTTIRMGVGAPPDAQGALRGAPNNVPKILLSHQPKLHQQARMAGFDAQISGHTHAGQYFPFTRMIRFFEPYYRGLYNVEGLSMFVSHGVGYWGPPLRERAGEIVLITLRPLESGN